MLVTRAVKPHIMHFRRYGRLCLFLQIDLSRLPGDMLGDSGHTDVVSSNIDVPH